MRDFDWYLWVRQHDRTSKHTGCITKVDATKTSTTFTLAGIVEQSEHKANYIIFSEHMLSEFEGDAILYQGQL